MLQSVARKATYSIVDFRGSKNAGADPSIKGCLVDFTTIKMARMPVKLQKENPAGLRNQIYMHSRQTCKASTINERVTSYSECAYVLRRDKDIKVIKLLTEVPQISAA